MAEHRWVYLFRDGNANQRDLLGGKGANLAEMTNVGLPVPPGFTITTEACNAFLSDGRDFPSGMWDQVLAALRDVEDTIGRKFGDTGSPLLVSVRSGAKFSMPGMMDTILNLGLNDQTVKGLAREADPRFAYDCYRRLIQMFAKVVLAVDSELFEDVIDAHKRELDVEADYQIPADHLERMVGEFKAIVAREAGRPFPDDPYEQLRQAVVAVFDSWNNRRAINYRNANGIPHNLGTAVNIQSMVYGNMGPDCATGVAFTRNPSTGENRLFGEYLTNAQGEDVVAGVRTPQPMSQMADDPALRPAYDQLQQIAERLEQHYRDVQDLEFTVQNGKLWMLQTRTGKRTGAAAVKTAVDMVGEGLISRAEAVQRVQPDQLDQLLHPTIDPRNKPPVLAVGLPASPGAATGQLVLDADEAKATAEDGQPVILVRLETSPEDFHGMLAAQAVLTGRGGMTSHAAVVARGMGKPAVVGCTALQVDYDRQQVSVNGTVVKKGSYITVDGSTGEVMLGQVPTIEPQVGGDLSTLLGWADEIRVIGVRANADTPQDAAKARELGAQGIGLCRTEHMFFEGNRIQAVREMIIATDAEERRAALAKLEPMQRADFIGIFTQMAGLPVTIRTLDPPLHEFLPHDDEEIAALAGDMGIDAEIIRNKVVALREANPMLGHRGCRLGITAPEITEMQARAIFGAALAVAADGIEVEPEIMIPLVADVRELRLQREVVDRVAREMFAEAGRQIPYLVGTMIELPRAALTADRIAEEAQFFSFGTNDLTQTAFGLSRDDSGRFLPYYVEHGIFDSDPFQVLDREGVGELIKIAVERGRRTRPDIKLGICGEHGGDPSSVEFCHQVGLNYVSASPFRVPIAWLAAAQAALEHAERDV
ncbi:MAG TPA: pyruvate, phosphate dikinase [Thermomicrobiaceae bacterium]|nr:pyruvate, phosphate dikinase [Thermomicrobiaceae bacterium]